MIAPKKHGSCLMAFLAAPAFASVRIVSMQASPPSPQIIGTPITFTVTATGGGSGPLTFRFNRAAPGAKPALVKDFNAGTLSAGAWTAQPFVWAPTGPEGDYQIQVVAKDFSTGETGTRTIRFTVNPLVTGSTPVAVPTANPLVALFSAPACAAGSSMRVSFRQNAPDSRVTATNWAACHPAATITFEVAGMLPSTTYLMHAQTRTDGTVTNGPNVKFTAGPLPTDIPFPTFKVLINPGSNTDTAEPVILWGLSQLGMETQWRDVATDLAGNIIWFYAAASQHPDLLTRPLEGGGMLTIQDDAAWNPASQDGQVVRQIDLAGNVVRETNTGVIQQQLLALGAADGGPCNSTPGPEACLGAFHHEAIALPAGAVPAGGFALLADIEKIFPPGTQGDPSGLPVDIVGDMIILLNAEWQVVWYFDAFEHDGGAPQLEIDRPAVLGETCAAAQAGCPPMFLLGSGMAPLAYDWLHANSLYFWQQTGDIVWSSKDQDWVMRVAYANGTGSGNILWRMGREGDFAFDGTTDPWPWFSHQHDVSLIGNGGTVLLFDNGDTRLAPPPLGLGHAGCEPDDCDSRAMALQVDETTMTVTPLLSQDLGVYSPADGSAQTLSNGNYFFQPPLVATKHGVQGYAIEIPPGGTPKALDVEGPEGYRGWRMPSLYSLN
jgi:hypothetical protein